MADIRDFQAASDAADSTQASLEAYLGQIEDSPTGGNVALVVGLAAVALCARLETIEVRLDYLAHELAKRAGL